MTLTFSDRRAAFHDGSDSPRQMLELCLARIADRDGEVKAFCHVETVGARVSADAATERYRAGRPLSAIDGMPIALKDIFETADMPTTFGTPIFSEWRGGRDSAVAYALRRAGAVLIGKTVTTEFAASHPGETRNPHDLAHTPGGSSSGSAAAVADGMVPLAMGSQVVGSVLRPASFCGVIGFKPTFGALNRGGICDSFSQNALGALANSIEDAVAVCHEIATRVGGDPGFAPFLGGESPAPARKPQRLAIVETAGWAELDAETRDQFDQVRDRLAGQGIAFLDRRTSRRVELLEQAIDDALAVTFMINNYESHWPLGELASRRGGEFSDASRKRVAESGAMAIEDYLTLLARRDAMNRALDALDGDIDAIITLASAGPAPLGLQSTGNGVFNAPFSALRVPAIALPLMKVSGLPVGVQLAGFPRRDRDLTGIAAFVLEAIGRA